MVSLLYGHIQKYLGIKLPGFSGRILHGRGGAAPGLEDFSADVFGSLLFIVVYRPLPQIVITELSEMLNRLLLEIRAQHDICSALLQERSSRGAEIVAVAGNPVPEKITFSEDALIYAVEPLRGQNPGFFFDTHTARSWVRESAANARVLNLFAYTCGFSVVAAAGRAKEVVNIDMKRPVLSRGRENHQLNFGDVPPCRISYHALDIMKSFSRVDRLGIFDLIIADPPSRQGRSFQYDRDYPKLLSRAGKWLAPGGVFMTLLNAPDAPENWLREQVEERIPGIVLMKEILKGQDFPESDPSRALLGLLWRRKD